MSSKRDPLAAATRVVEAALNGGADAADAYVRAASGLDIQVRNGAIETFRRAASFGLGLRVQVDGRTALVHTTDTEGLSLLALIRQALSMARALPQPDEPTIFATPREGAPAAFAHPDPELRDEAEEKKVARMQAVEKAMLAVPGVSRSGGVGYGEGDGAEALVNSNGLSLYAPFCNIELRAEALVEKDGENYSGGRYLEVSARSRLLDSETIGRDAARRATSLLGARPVETCRVPVIFTPYNGWALMVYLVQPLRGDNVAQERSYLNGRLGEQIAASGVDIRDNALLKQGAARRRFDGEGTACRDLLLVEGGVLRSYLTDLASAKKLGVAATGHAVRGQYTSQPSIATSNYYMEPGGHTPEEIIRNTERGLVLATLSGWWVGLSPVTDTFSSAAMGYWVEGGEIVHPVKGVTIGGSVQEMLKGIDMIGNDVVHLAPTTTPTFRVAEMALAGV